MQHGRRLCLIAALTATLLPAQRAGEVPERLRDRPGLELRPASDRRTQTTILRGHYSVWENRTQQAGRKIALNLLILPATGPAPRPDPVFYLAGGPGQAATRVADGFVDSWMREERDLVFVDQRGTGDSNPLQVETAGIDDAPQGYLEPLFDVERFRAALPHLQQIADLTQYTTEIAADDLDEVRAALGYQQINVIGGSYGTRAALIYLRRHHRHARTAVLNGVAPVSMKNPLTHARSAQDAIDLLFAEAAVDPRANGAFDDLHAELRTILERLDEEPAPVTLRDAQTHKEIEVVLTRDAFAGALRVMMYYLPANRRVPLLVHRAFEGDYVPFAEQGIRSAGGIRQQLAMGMLMCVVGSEDIARITPEEIGPATAGTFLGDVRVRQQMAVAAFWPRGDVDADYGEPVSVDTPVLLLSGTLDPVSPPGMAADAARHLPNSLHLVVPGAHGVGGACITAITRAFLDRGTVDGLDTSCTKAMRLPPLEVPR